MTNEAVEMQEAPSAAQVAEIVGQVTADKVCGFNYRIGNYNSHCFVTLDSGQQLVIRFSRRGWEGGHWKIEKFAREACAAGILAVGTGLATPQTFMIDGSRSIVNAVYAVQSFVPGQVFKKVFKAATADEQACLLRKYGAVASRIHAIKLPKCDYDEDYAYMACSPIQARCPQEYLDVVVDRLAAQFGNKDGTCFLTRSSFHRAAFTDDSTERFMVEIDEGIGTLRDEGKISVKKAVSLGELFERNSNRISEHLERRNLCHGDYHFANIMVDKANESSDWEIVGLFDHDLTQVTCPFEDFGKAEEFDFPNLQIPGLRRHILDGYKNLSQLEYGVLILGVWLSEPDYHDRAQLLIERGTEVNEDTVNEGLF